MTDPATRLLDAEAEAAAARERLSGTLRKLQVRLNPRDLAKQAARDVADKGRPRPKPASTRRCAIPARSPE